MINENSIRACLQRQNQSLFQIVFELTKSAPHKRQVHDLSDTQISAIFKTIITVYHQTQTQDRSYLDWISNFLNQLKTKQDLNKELGNNLIVSLLNSFAHHFLYAEDEQSMEKSLQNITHYIEADVPVDIILLSIGVNNNSVLQMTKGNYESAYKLSSSIVQKLEQFIEDSKMKKSKLIEEDVVVLANTYLIICQALDAHLKHKRQWGKLQYHYQVELSHTYTKGVKMSSYYLGEESVITKAYRNIKDLEIVNDIPIIKVSMPPEDASSPSEVKIDGILKMLESRIQYIEEIFVNDEKPEQLMPSISAIQLKKSEISIKKETQFIKQINSFDDIPLNPTISNQIPVSPVYSSVAPIEFPAIRKSPISSPAPTTPQSAEIIPVAFVQVVERMTKSIKIERVEQAPEVVKTPTIIEKIVELEIDSSQAFPQPVEELEILLEIIFQKFIEPENTLITRLYKEQKTQLFLIKQQKQIDNLVLSQQQIQGLTTKLYAAPFLLSKDNISAQQKILFFLLPYCDMVDQKLCLLPFPRSIIPPLKVFFLGKQVNVIVSFVQLNQFRVILTTPENKDREYFSYQLHISEEEADEKIINYVQNMQTNHKVRNLFNKYNRFKINTDPVEIVVNCPIFKKLDKFVNEVKQSVVLVEEFMQAQQLQNEQLSQYLLIYNLDQFRERSSINCIKQESHEYIIRLQNHLKYTHKIIKMRDKISYSFENARQDLGELLFNPSQSEKKYIKYIISDKHRLRKIRKDFVDEDYVLYSPHPIDEGMKFLNIGFKRIIHYDQNITDYWILTITLICNVDNIPLGIKVNLYFPVTTHTESIFIPLSRYLWIKQRKTSQGVQNKLKITQAEKRRLKKKIFYNQFPVVTNYNVSHIMNKGGFQQIIDLLEIRDGKITVKQLKTSRLQNLLFDDFE